MGRRGLLEVGTFQSAEDRPFYEETKKAEVCVSIDCAVPEGSMGSVERVQNSADHDGSGFTADLYGNESLDGCRTR